VKLFLLFLAVAGQLLSMVVMALISQTIRRVRSKVENGPQNPLIFNDLIIPIEYQ